MLPYFYTALPRLTHDLNASASEKLWIMNAYPLIVAGLLPAAGMLTDRIGHKTLFISGLPFCHRLIMCGLFPFNANATSLIISYSWFLGHRCCYEHACNVVYCETSIYSSTRACRRHRYLVCCCFWWRNALGPLIGGIAIKPFLGGGHYQSF